MEEMKHTPGPWVCQTQANGSSIRHPVVLSDDGAVAMVQWCESAQKTNANASLIAAAPEMLESLQEVLPMLEQLLMIRGEPEPGSIGHKARAAIAKAIGA